MFTPSGLFINGHWRPASGGSIPVINPASEAQIFRAPDASAADIDGAVSSAREAFDNGAWPRLTLQERKAVIGKIMDLVRDRTEELAQIQSAQMGAPIANARIAVRVAVTLIQSYIDAAESIEYEYLRRDAAGQSLVRRESVGVVAAIAPWNGPLLVAINKIIPALLVGCTVVAKPAPETPAETALLAQLCTEAGIPDGVFNVVFGGREAGEHLVTHRGVDKVTFTGSTAAGRRVAELCAPHFTRVSLELGGKSAGIVLEDADIAATAPLLAAANFSNSGQACIALSRVLAPRRVHDELVQALCAQAATWKVGDPLDETTRMGPLVAERQRRRVLDYIAGGVADGAVIACGGDRPPELERGWYVQPTVITGVANSMAIAREEIFGPVICVIPYDSVDEAVAIANDSEFGLHGGIFTRDAQRGLAIARRIRSGSVSLNGFGLTPATPYGGVKGSGVGREHGPEGVAAFLETKAYVVPTLLADALAASGVPEG